MSTLTFSKVCAFLRSGEYNKAHNESTFEEINTFLKNNENALIHLSTFSIDKEHVDLGDKINLRGYTYEVSSEEKQLAIELSSILKVHCMEAVRIIHLYKKNYGECEIDKAVLAEKILHERNSILDIVILLANHVLFPVIKDSVLKVILRNRSVIMEELIKLLQNFFKKFNSPENDSPFNELVTSYDVMYITNILNYLALISLNKPVESKTLLYWYQFLEESNYFSSIFGTEYVQKEAKQRIEALGTILTVLMTGFNTTSSSIDVESPFFNDEVIFKSILDIIVNSQPPPFLLYYWSFVLYTKSYLLEEEPENNLKFVEYVFNSEPILNLIDKFVNYAEKQNVFDCITCMATLLKQKTFYCVILSSFLLLSLCFIPLNARTASIIRDVLKNTPSEFIEQFLVNEAFEKKFFLLKSKAPLLSESLIPMITLASVSAEFAHFELKELDSYIQELSLGSLDYDLADDTKSTDLIMLKKCTYANMPLEENTGSLVPIPENTKAKILPANTEKDILMFLYKYSGWSLVGRVFQNGSLLYLSSNTVADGIEPTREFLVSTIDLISEILTNSSSLERTNDILHSFSSFITDGDIFSVLFKILEHSLQIKDYVIIKHAIKVLTCMLDNYPRFVWSHLARSELLDRYGKTGVISIILGTMELPSGEYSITIELVKLCQKLVHDSLNLETEFPRRLQSEILSKFVQHFIHVYESYQYWNYSSVRSKFELGTHLTALFTNIIYNVHSIDPNTTADRKITRVLADASSHITKVFLSNESPDVRTATSLVQVLASWSSSEAYTLDEEEYLGLYNQWQSKSFDFSNLLISIRVLLQLPPSTLESKIFQSLQDLVEIYIIHHSSRTPIIKLLTHLIRAPWPTEYPSLLAHLGEKHSTLLIKTFISDLESVIDDYRFLGSFFSFFSAVMEGKQDGFSILLVTGKKVSTSLELPTSATTKVNKVSVLSLLKQHVLKIDNYPESVGSQLLEAISLAYNSWTAARSGSSDQSFIDYLVSSLENFNVKTMPTSLEETIKLSNNYRLNARIAEIFALHLYTSANPFPSIANFLNKDKLPEVVRLFFTFDGYDKELKATINEEFKSLWPKLELTQFSVSPLLRIGGSQANYVYEIELLDQFLISDERWVGTKPGNGFREKLIKCAINLQFVSFQISAAKSWGALLTAFIKKQPGSLKPSYIEICDLFMDLNIDKGAAAPIFKDIFMLRIELIFYILYSIHQTSTPVPESKLEDFLSKLLVMLKSKEVNYLENVLLSSKNLYRPIIRSILIILTLAKSYPMFLENCSDYLLDFFEFSFSKGVNLILSDILSSFNVASSQSKQLIMNSMTEKFQDLLLLLSIFTKVRELRPLPSFFKIIASSLDEFGTLKSLMNVYYSSYLLISNDAPLFAEVTLSFISEMVMVQPVAKKMIDNGLFSVFLESPISVAIQQGNIRPEHSPRLHSIWSNGLLTIILQLLSEFGPSILSEVCLFASYFCKQIQSTINGWSSESICITQAFIQETSQLILLQKMLEKLDYQTFLERSNTRFRSSDNTSVVELISGLDNESERKEFAQVLRHYLTHPKYMNSRILAPPTKRQKLDNENYRNNLAIIITKQISELQTSLTDDI